MKPANGPQRTSPGDGELSKELVWGRESDTKTSTPAFVSPCRGQSHFVKPFSLAFFLLSFGLHLVNLKFLDADGKWQLIIVYRISKSSLDIAMFRWNFNERYLIIIELAFLYCVIFRAGNYCALWLKVSCKCIQRAFRLSIWNFIEYLYNISLTDIILTLNR